MRDCEKSSNIADVNRTLLFNDATPFAQRTAPIIRQIEVHDRDQGSGGPHQRRDGHYQEYQYMEYEVD